jgi:FkbM family methyltransferase
LLSVPEAFSFATIASFGCYDGSRCIGGGRTWVYAGAERDVPIDAELLSGREVLEAGSQRRSQAVYLGDRTALCRVLGSYLVFVDTRDVGIAPHLCLNGFWESWVTLAIARAVGPGAHCVDIGANHGYYTLLMADIAGPAGRTLAVEPNPRLVDLLQRSLAVNGLTRRVDVVQGAALDRSGEPLVLSYPPHFLNATLVREVQEADEVIRAASVTLDDLTRDWPRLDLVKIDAEGAEEAIWRGGRETWQRRAQVAVVLELNTARYTDPPAFLGAIRAEGFRFATIGGDGQLYPISEQQILTEHPGEDWMLFLRRD